MYTSTDGQMTFNAFKAWMLTNEAANVIEGLRNRYVVTCSLLENWLKREDSLKRRERIAKACISIVNADEQMRGYRIFAEEIDGANYMGIGVRYLGISHLKVSRNRGNRDERKCNIQLDPGYGAEKLAFGCLRPKDSLQLPPLCDDQEPDDNVKVVRRLFSSFLESVSRFRDEPWRDGCQAVKSYSELMLYLESLPCSFCRQIKEERWFVISYTPCDEQLYHLNYLPWAFKTAKSAKRAVEEIAEYIVPCDWDRYKVLISDDVATITHIQRQGFEAHTLTQAHVEQEMEVIKLQVEQITVPRNRMIPTLNVPPVWDWKAVRTNNWETRNLTMDMWLEKLDPGNFDRETWAERSAESDRYAKICDWWKLDSTRIESRQWIFVLRHRPELAACCKCWKKEDWNPYEWCLLLRRQPQFADRCPWPLDEMPADWWVFLLRKQPQFAERFNRWDEVWSYSWPRLLKDQPQFASHCDWEKLDGWEWASLLKERTEFASRCDWEKLSGDDWAELLSVRPEFAPHCVWEKLSGGNWTRVLNCRPEFASHCDWKKLYGFNWVKLLSVQPEFDSHCDWEELDANDWVGLLIARPEFASHCAWGKLSEDNWNVLLTHGLLMAHPEWVKHFHVWDRLSEMQKMRFLKKSALFCEFVDWEELTLDRRIDYLLLRPEFQDKMDWSDVTDELDWFRLLSVFPQYQKYAPERKGANVDRSYVWIGRCGPIVVIPGGGSYLVDDRQRVGWYEVTPRGICCDKNEHKVKTYMSYQDAKRVVAKIFGEQTGKAYSVVAIDGVYVEADGHQGRGNFATIMKEWLANNVTSIKILYLEYGWAYDVSALET